MNASRAVASVVMLFGTAFSPFAADSSGIATLPIPTHRMDAFRCDVKACAMPAAGSYPHLLIGVFKTSATPAQSEQLFRDMRAHKLWADLPDDATAFYATLQPVAIQLSDGSSLAVLIGQDEARVAPSEPGDLVRYSPHRGKYEIPPTDPKARAYWATDGCVAVLCRAKDRACFSRYVQGVYCHDDGIQISPQTFKPLTKGIVIDPQSMLPKISKGSTT